MSSPIVLADTNVIIELVKSKPDPQVMRWLQSVQRMSISAVTLEEANFGLAWQPNARKLALFNALVERLHAVYAITPAIAQRPRYVDCRHCHGAPIGAGHAQCARLFGLWRASHLPV